MWDFKLNTKFAVIQLHWWKWFTFNFTQSLCFKLNHFDIQPFYKHLRSSKLSEIAKICYTIIKNQSNFRCKTFTNLETYDFLRIACRELDKRKVHADMKTYDDKYHMLYLCLYPSSGAFKTAICQVIIIYWEYNWKKKKG